MTTNKNDLTEYTDDELFAEWEHEMSLLHQTGDINAWAKCVSIEAEQEKRNS